MSENTITNPEKTEGPKNPKRVEQGKRLAAISREAKERKRQEQEKFLESEDPQESEHQGKIILFGVGVIGAAFLAYKIFFDSKNEDFSAKVVEDASPEEPEEPEDRETEKTNGFKPYLMD